MECSPAIAVLTLSILSVSPSLVQAALDAPPADINRLAIHSSGAALDVKPVSREEYLALYERGLPPMRGPRGDAALKNLLSPLSAVGSTAAVSGGDPVEKALCDRSAVVGAVLGFAAAKGDEEMLSHDEVAFDFLVEGYLEPARRKHILNPFAPIGFLLQPMRSTV